MKFVKNVILCFIAISICSMIFGLLDQKYLAWTFSHVIFRIFASMILAYFKPFTK